MYRPSQTPHPTLSSARIASQNKLLPERRKRRDGPSERESPERPPNPPETAPIDEARPSLRLLSRNTLFDEHMIKVKAEVNQRTQPYVSEAWRNFIMQTATHNGWIDPIP